MPSSRSIRKSPFILQHSWSVALLLGLAAQSSYADSFWTGGTSNDWNLPANWSAGYPGGTNAIVNPNGGAFPIPTISANATTVNDIRINDTGAGTATVNQTGGTITQTGWFRIATTAGGTGIFNMSGGTETVTGGRVHIGESGTGVMNISGGATINASGGEGFVLGANANSNGTVNQTGGTVNKTNGWFSIGGNSKGTYNISAGSLSATGDFNLSDGSASRGVLNVSGTGLVTSTGSLLVGKTNGATGLINVSGGTVNANLFTLGGANGATNAGKGFATVTGGQLNASGELWVGQGGNTNGLMDLSGGTVSANSWFVVGRGGGYGVLNVSGTGTARMTAGNRHIVVGTNAGTTGILNMTGGSVEATNGGDLKISEATGSGTVNLLGGTLKVDHIADSGGNSYLHMSGGTMQARIATTTFLEGIDTAVVGTGGAIFDTNGNNITVNQTLAAPTGSGVSSIPVTGGGSGYAAQPIVKLTGGGGTGASAIANLTGGVVTSITVTNPGIGYTSAPTVALVDGGATTGATFGAAVIAANATTGGLTKTGAGTMIVGSTNNSYGGVTTITGGTLSVATLFNGGINSTLGASSSAASNLVFNGGALQYTGGSISTDRNWTASAGQSAIFDVSTAGTVLTLSGGSAATNGGLTKIGNGTLALTGTNLHTGTTTVNGGVLAANGTYSGGFAVGGGGHLTALNLAEGALTVPSLTLSAGSNVDFEFGAGATLNGTHDIITAGNAGGLSLTSTGLYLYQTGGTTAFTANGTYTLFDYNSTFTGPLASAFTIANSQVGKLYNIVNNATATTIELSIADTVITSWKTDGSGLWSNGANWTAGVPNSFGAIATFPVVAPEAGGTKTVTVDGLKTVGVITFDNATNAYILSGGVTDIITLNNGSGTPLISQVSGSHTIAAPLALIAATNVAPAAGTTLLISGSISGVGSLNVTDTGTVALTGANSYGSTAVNAGSLNVGDGVATAASLGSGPVTLGTGTLLTFNRPNAMSVANSISGAGAVTQAGTGTLTYSGTATHTGATVLNGPFINDGTFGTAVSATSSLDVESTATFRNSSSARVAGAVLVANTASVTAVLTVQDAATFVATGATTVAGAAGSMGSLNVSGTGSYTTNGLTVGNNGGVGTLNVSSGTLNGAGINIGGNSAGFFNMNGGTVTATTFHVGQNSGGNGIVNMLGGTLTSNQWSVIAQRAGTIGDFTMSGGVWNQNHTDILTVGENGNGTFTMTGGILNDAAVDTSNRNTNKGNVYVGRNNGGVGLWDIRGSSVAHIRELMVGNNAGSDGTVTIGGTALVDSSYDFHIGRAGTGRVNINGGTLNTTSGWTQVGIDAGGIGTLQVNAGSISSREYLIGGAGTGTVNVAGGMLTATQPFRLGDGVAGTGFLTVSGTGTANMNNEFYAGYRGFALATISDNAVLNLTNVFGVGYFGTAQGYVRQTGGTVLPGGGGDWRIGGVDPTAAAAVGFYDLSGGSFNTNHNFQIGAYGSGLMSVGGAGVATVTGGFPVVGRFAGSFGVLDVTVGGSFTDNSNNRLIVGEEGTGTLNVRGGTVTENTASSTLAVSIGLTATGNGTVNLLGGTLSTLSVGAGAGSSTLNFNGGTLQASGSNPTFLQGLTKTYVYSGGGVIDTQANTIVVAQALLAPTGSGVTGIPVTSGGAGYQAAPIVKITGGGGTGATAVATLNNLGQVSGIIITSPGVDYTSAPTVALIGGTPTAAAGLAPATVAPNASGTLTKTGSGTLTLTGAQTYGALTTGAGVTNLNASFTGGTSTVNANATLNINASQSLAALNVGAGVEVTFGEAVLLAPAPDKFSAPALVPEPGALGLLLVGVLGLAARRRR